ncbi:MAG: hypothetical protein R3C26_02770 [Calditrichia bacterium]
MSRTGVELGSITIHPHGLAHTRSRVNTKAPLAKETDEYAVMLDTFRSADSRRRIRCCG